MKSIKFTVIMVLVKGTFDKRIRNILIKYGLVTEEQADEIIDLVDKDGGRGFQEIIVEDKKYITEGDYLSAIALEARVPPVDIEKIECDEEALGFITRELAEYYCVLPLTKIGHLLTIATSNPFDLLKLDEISVVTNCEIRPVVTNEKGLRRAIQHAYNPQEAKMEEIMSKAATGREEIEVKEVSTQEEEVDLSDAVSDSNKEAPVIKLVNMVIIQAMKEKASDIHIEAYEKASRVRYRVDGALRDSITPPISMHPAIVSRVKVLSGMNIAEKRIPQDGKMQVRYEGRQVDIRASVLPTIHGEKVVLRILDSSNLNMGINELGFEAEATEAFKRAIGASYGMLLVTGPTGSGKSTTLYAALKELMNPEENIVTVEDPVEYQLEGINQVPVNVKRGLTFAGALRSILRQDPDIVMIGEIRDHETADIAVKAAITGHLVLSTLHTNDAASSITRLVDMGVDSFMVASSVILVAAQRLCRKLCNRCKQPLDTLPDKNHLLKIGFEPEQLENLILHQPVGCPACNNGYKGRFAILEVLEVDEIIRRMIIEKKSSVDMKAHALKKGMTSLRKCAIVNAMRGKTSLEEVLNMTMGDEL